MMRRPYSFTIIIVAGLILAVAATFFFSRLQGHKPTTPAAPTTNSNATVELLDSDLFILTPQSVTRSLGFTGSLRALNQVDIKSKLAGDIREIRVREGEQVRAQQILARMDNLEAQAHADQNIASLEIAQRNYDNNKRLLDRGFISATAFESSVSNLKAAQAAVALTNKSLRETLIRSPIAGQIAQRTVQAGEKVPMDYKLFSVIDPSHLEIEAQIPAEEINAVKVGQAVQLQVAGINTSVTGKTTGKVTRINPATTANSRAIAVYIEIDNPENARAGMFVEGQIILESRTSVLVIPSSALVPNKPSNNPAIATDSPLSSATVLRLDPQNKLTLQTVTLGLRSGPGRDAQVEVLSGLNSGDRILRTQMDHLPQNAVVKIIKDSSVTTNTSAAATPAP